MILESLILLGIGAIGVSASSMLIGIRIGRKASSSKEETPAGTAKVSWSYTIHPDEFFEVFERDLTLLNPDDRVSLRINAAPIQGWKNLNKYNYLFEPINGRVDQVSRAAKALMMDDNSPLVSKSKSPRQKGFLIRSWGGFTGVPLSWQDSDSPMAITVSGTVTAPVKICTEKDIETDPDLVSAIEEVERTTLKHRAALQATHGREHA